MNASRWYRCAWLLGCSLSWLLAFAHHLRAQDTPPARPAVTWAYLVGVEDYQKAPKLAYTVNDVKKLAEVLTQYGHCDPNGILELTDQENERGKQPYQASILYSLPRFVKSPEAQDTVIVYFSGHGFRADDGRLYLAPIDCDPKAATKTGISVEWLREQLLACKAGFKLLILDACHAGSEKGDDVESISAKDIGDQFKQAAGVITLASSTADEKSQIWQFKEQSLFSYWLTQGLKGHADADGDGNVNVDELYQYVHSHVTQTAKVRFTRSQTPVRIVGPRIAGVPTVSKLRPQGLKQVMADMADQISGTMDERELAKIGVLEFTNDTKYGEMLGANFGLLGRYCSEELERNLTNRSTGNYQVVDRHRLQDALKRQGFGLKELSSTESLANLAKQAGGMPVLVRGTLADRNGRMVTLRCKVIETEGDATLASVGGMVALNESEWAMLGRSVALSFNDRYGPDNAPAPGVEPISLDDHSIHVADKKSRGPHPLQDPKFAFPIKFVISGKERKLVFKQLGEGPDKRTECFLPVRNSEKIDIHIENRSGEVALMRLLLDGLNTLPEKEQTKGVSTYVWGKRMSLDDARAWVLDPATVRGPKKIWAIRGFVTNTGAAGSWREFVVVDADKSLAARQQFTDQLGLISAAFFATAPGSRAPLGIGAGEERSADLTERAASPGTMLSVVHVRYVDADTLTSP